MTDKTGQACIATSFFLTKTNAKGQIADTISNNRDMPYNNNEI